MADDPTKPPAPISGFQLSSLLTPDLLKTIEAANTVAATTAASIAHFNSVGFAENLGNLFPDPVKVRSLEDQIRTLRDDLNQKTLALRDEKFARADHEKRAQELKATLDELTKKQQLAFLLDRVRTEAADVLLDSTDLRGQFLSPEPARFLRCP